MQLKAFTNEQGVNFLLSLLDNFASLSQTDKEAAISVSKRFNGLPASGLLYEKEEVLAGGFFGFVQPKT